MTVRDIIGKVDTKGASLYDLTIRNKAHKILYIGADESTVEGILKNLEKYMDKEVIAIRTYAYFYGEDYHGLILDIEK